MLKESKQLENKNYLLFLDDTQICRDTKVLFKGKIKIIVHTNLNTVIKRFLQKNNQFALNVGLSHYKNVPESEILRSGDKIKWGQGTYGFKEGHNLYINYFILRQNNANFFSYKNLNISENQKKNLFNKLEINENKKIALIHIKTSEDNACAKRTNPNTYLKAMNYLIRNNYQLIFYGREKIPEIFKSLPIINYANSNYTSWMNDVVLVEKSSLFICFASGIGALAGVLDKPLLYIGYWTPNIVHSNKKSIFIPTLLKKKNDQKFLTFKKHLDYLYECENQNFASEDYDPINPDEEDILNSVKELILLSTNNLNFNEDQIKFNKIFGNDIPLYYCQSHVSSSFLKKYNYLL